jgi:hypothetical protein
MSTKEPAMAVTSYSTSDTAQMLHLNTSQLTMIINQTGTAVDEMNRLNNQVDSTAATIGGAMQSDAGRLLNNRLAIWNGDYAQVVSQLNELNGRATDMLNALVAANTGATQAAPRGQ